MKAPLLRLLGMLFWTPVVLLLLLILNTVLHMGPGICVWHRARFDPGHSLRVVHGLPTAEMIALARRHRIALGGYSPSHAKTACPYCGWPVRLRK